VIKKDYFALPAGLQSLEEDIPKGMASPTPEGMVSPRPLKRKPGVKKDSDFTLKGEYQVGFGIEGSDFLWKKANYNLNEENTRILSDDALNRRENTFDPAVYSYIRFEIDRPREEGWSFHSNFDISPWSFIGKSKQAVVTSDDDVFDIEYKYWSNMGYTVNEVVYSNLRGDSVALPEMKVVDGKVPLITVTSLNTNVLTIPELEIDREFWPFRELWADYKSDNITLKIFPVGMADMAYTSDDPLRLSNHRNYWEESQWLINWQPGHLNSGLATPDFQKGWWDDSLVFSARDSASVFLTSLRGFSLNLESDKTDLDFTVASPKELWQDYDSFSTFESALRGKYYHADNFKLGFIHTSKLGRNKDEFDAYNYAVGVDASIGLGDNTEVLLAGATSRSEFDRSSSTYKTEKRGNSFHVSLINSSSEMAGKNYFGLIPKDEESFYKLRLALTHMDKGFESILSSFCETRDDAFWSRHLTFRKPFGYYYGGLYGPSLSWDDLKTFRIGDGIDYGRDVVGLRWEGENFLSGNLDVLFDLRNVHDTNGKYIENVTRLETTYKLTPRLTTKLLGIYHDLPKTVAGIDPFVIDADSGDNFQNSLVEDGKDPSLKTVSLGTKYDFFDWLDLSFVWEHTNDSTLAYDNSPRALLHWTSFTTFSEYDNTFRKEIVGLNHPGEFPLPPYSYFDIFKVGLGLRPKDNLEIYLDYTRNEYKWAHIIDDNVNHIGLEAGYSPSEKIGFYFRYVYSRMKDISELNEDSRVVNRDHHSVFSEMRLRLSKDSELIGQYGVGSTAGIAMATFTPFGGGVA
ncbi:MAG: hypothetical protein HQ579_03765, partial [Candidatus Omnitrophica bacterium]|nr:hypothetical protein [Candidatus Omnitrophota bacterium]